MLRVRTELTGWEGGPGLMTQYFETPLEDAAAAIRVRQYVHDLIGTGLAHVYANVMTWTVQHEVDVVTAATGATTTTLSDSANHTATGGAGTTRAPLASAGLVQWRTATWVAGRNIKGRTYCNPMAAACVGDDGKIAAGTLSTVNGAITSYLAGLDSGDSQVVWHRPKSGSGGSVAIITAGVLASKIAVLTSRRD